MYLHSSSNHKFHLRLCHSYLIGPLPTPSYGNSRYMLTLIDYFSRYCWVYFLKLKYEVLETFKMYKALVENACGNKIKVLRKENGKEYSNNILGQLCKKCGIQMHHSVPYTSQQNGVAECKNITLKEMATCMMEAKDLNSKLWDEAINCVAYVRNISPHKSFDDKTPFEAWSGHKPNVSHFRVFCSKAWARIPPEKRKELQPEIKRYIMESIC